MLDRQARAFLWAPQDCNRVLDFGCRSGDLIGRLALESIGHEWVGCDVDSRTLYSTLTKRKGRLVEKILKWDLSLELGRFSYNGMVKVARK